MKNPFLFLALLLIPACYGEDDTRAAERRGTTPSGTNVPATAPGTDADWTTLESYEFERRADFDREVERRIAELDREYDRAKSAVADRSALDNARQELRTAMDNVKSATAETWRESRDAVLTSARRFREALRDATR